MYTKQSLKTGDKITQDYLDKIEDGIAGAYESDSSSTANHPVVNLTGDISGMSKDVEKTLGFEYINGAQVEKGFAKVSWQGDSSINYPKKNLKIKLYSDELCTKKYKIVPRSGWKKDSKFVLKANWVDATHSRNIVNSNIWSQLTKNRVYNSAHNRDVNYMPDANFDNMIDYWNRNPDYYKLGDKKVDGYNTLQFDGSKNPSVSNLYPGSDNVTMYLAPWGANFKMAVKKGDTVDINLKALVTQHNTTALDKYQGDFVIGVKETKANIGISGNSAWDNTSAFKTTTLTDFEEFHKKYTVSNEATTYLIVEFWAIGNTKGYFGKPQVNKNVTTVPAFALNPLDTYFDTANAQNYGSIDGFPIQLFINDGDQGMYTFNLSKNSALYGLDGDNEKNIAISGVLGNGSITTAQPVAGSLSLLDTKTAKLDGTDYDLESDIDVNDNIKADFNRLLTFINTATNEEFAANAGTFIDINSVIDMFLFAIQSMNFDAFTKSYILFTHDGNFWQMAAYDNDTTWKLRNAGSVVVKKADYYINTSLIRGVYNRLMWRVIYSFNSDIVARWNEVKENELSVDNISANFKAYIQSVSPYLYSDDAILWPTRPSLQMTSLQQIQRAIISGTKQVDNFINDFPNYDSFPSPTLLS